MKANPYDRLRYLARRIRGAGIAEPFQRLGSWMRHRRERREFGADPDSMSVERLWKRKDRWLMIEPDADPVHAINQALLSAVPQGWWQDSSYWDAFSETYPEQREQLIADARTIFAGRVRLFQWKEIEIGNPPQWSETMEPGRAAEKWPEDYYADIRIYHDRQRPERDIKWCWELNRFQHLLCLGAAWRLTGDEGFATAARGHLESWMASEQYPIGIHWSSNLEVGLRALSWARCHLLCSNSASWDRDFVARFTACLYIHGLHLEKELTVHHTPGNHLLGEAAALFCLSVLYPLFADSVRWRPRAVQILNGLVPRIILSDGVYAEQAIGYFRFVAEFLLESIHLARHAGIRFSDEVLRRLSNGLRFIHALSPDFRDIPMIGDSDTGRAIGWQLSDFWDFSSLPAAGAVLLNDASLFDGLKEFPAEAFLLVGREGLRRFSSRRQSQLETVRHRVWSQGIIDFPHGGYQISRDDRFSLIFDSGPLGIPPGYGHGHADGLSFVLHYGDKPLIVDTGTFVYNGPLEWREYFRSTAAHNTLNMDGAEQSRPLDTFRWAEPLKIKRFSPFSGTNWRLLHGSVEWGSMFHQRFMLHAMNCGLIIMDFVKGSGNHALEWFMHFDPHWNIRQAATEEFAVAWADKEIEIFFIHEVAATHSVVSGFTEPMAGWYSRYYGCRIPTATLRSCMKASLPAVMIFGIKPAGTRIGLAADSWVESLPPEIVTLLRSTELITFAESIGVVEPVS